MGRARSGQTRLAPVEPMRSSVDHRESICFSSLLSLPFRPPHHYYQTRFSIPPEKIESNTAYIRMLPPSRGRKTMVAWTILENNGSSLFAGRIWSMAARVLLYEIFPMGQEEVVGPPVVPTNGKSICDGSGPGAPLSPHPTVDQQKHNSDTCKPYNARPGKHQHVRTTTATAAQDDLVVVVVGHAEFFS